MKKIIVLALVMLLAGNVFATLVRTETFDTGLGLWTDVLSNTSNNQNFGWRNSSNAGGTAGELGGTFARNTSNGNPAHIWDSSIGVMPTAAELTIKGVAKMAQLTTRDGGIQVGYFVQGNHNVKVGFSYSEPATGPRIFAYAGGGSQVVYTAGNNQVINFDLTFTSGVLSGTINGVEINVVGAPVSGLNAFGIALNNSAISGTKVRKCTAYFDNMGYTPEPATIALLGLGGLLLRRKRS